MRRLLPVLAGLVIIAGVLLLRPSDHVAAQSYGPDITASAACIDGGHNGTNVCGNGFDDSTGTNWLSSQAGAAVGGAAWIGQDFGAGNLKQIRYVTVRQGATITYEVNSIKIENSADNVTWNTVQISALALDGSYQAVPVSASAAYRYWRIRANANTTANQWSVVEIEMSELVSWPTNTPGATQTPTITLTPSSTPSPTPDFNEIVTSTAGAPMRIEHSATYGEQNIFGVLLAIAFIMVLFFAVWLWAPRRSA